MSTELNSS